MDKKTVAIAILSPIILVAGGISWMSPGADSEKHTGGDDTQMNWYLADFHIHPWNPIHLILNSVKTILRVIILVRVMLHTMELRR